MMLFLCSARSVNVSSSGLSSTSRMTSLLIDRLLVCKGEVERRAMIHLALRPDASAVPADDALHGRQPDSCALEFRRRMQALKHAEQLRRIRHVEAGPVVTDEIRQWLSRLRNGPELFACARHLGSELQRVSQKVLEQDAHEPAVPIGDETVGDRELDLTFRVRTVKAYGGGAREAGEIEAVAVQLGARHTREHQEIVDQLRHVLRRVPDASEVFSSLRAEAVGVVLQECLAEAVDAAQRTAELVGDRVAERLQLVTRAFGPLLGARQALLEALALGDVARDLRRPDDVSRSVANRRHCNRDVQVAPILCAAHRIEGLDALAPREPLQDVRLLVAGARRQQQRHRLADHFFRRIAEDLFRPAVPASDDPLERSADDRVVRRIDDGRQPEPQLLHLLALRDVADGARYQPAVLGLDRAQADFDRKLRAVLPAAVELQARAHGANLRRCKKTGAMLRMLLTESLGYQDLDPFTQELVPRVPEERLRLRVDELDAALAIHDDHRIRCGFQQIAELALGF